MAKPQTGSQDAPRFHHFRERRTHLEGAGVDLVHDRVLGHPQGVAMTSNDPFARARLALRHSAAVVLSTTLALAAAPAGAQSTIADASVLSALPIAVSVAAPVAVLSTGAALTVVAVEATSTGAV
jgi:hypothetical protein